MALAGRPRANVRLPPDVNRILFVRNLPFKITSEEMYDLFGKYGPIRQIRIGSANDTKGTAFVVFEDIFDAKVRSQFFTSGELIVALLHRGT